MKKRAKKRRYVDIVVGLVIILAGIASLDYYFTFYCNNISESVDAGTEVFIYSSYDFDKSCEAIIQSGAIRNTARFIRAARHLDLDETIKSGHYTFKKSMNNKAIVRMFAKGWQKPVRISFPGYVRTLEKFAGQLAGKLEADSTSFAETFLNEETMKKYGFEKKDFIGMFIPNTYEVYWTITPEEFVERMNDEYESFWNEERTKKAEKAGLSRKEVSTLASIVIEETKYEPEMPVVAGVYMNRLKKGMLLQADPTVKFALGDEKVTRILNKHLTFDSPYNTYIHKGLPPGPITMPPVSALDAVLNYQHHSYLYFCAKETFDGQHNFAATLAQHNANAQKYHKALSAREKGNR